MSTVLAPYETVVQIGGVEIKIDKADLPIVSSRKWFFRRGYRPGEKQYISGHKNKQTCYLHRVILRATKGQIVDHINGDTLDNRRCNLRLATYSGNSANSIRRAPKAGYRGVRPLDKSDRFCARITINKQIHYLGSFDCAVDAAQAYDRAALSAFGAFARTNFPAPARASGELAQ